MEQVDGETLAWFRDRQSVYEYLSIIRQFLPNPRHFCPMSNVLISLRFFVFVEFSSTFFACANFVPIFCEKFFRQKLNKINRLRIFFRSRHFGTDHAITYTEHDETSRLREASGLEDRKLFHVGFNGVVFDIGFHFAPEFVETASGA